MARSRRNGEGFAAASDELAEADATADGRELHLVDEIGSEADEDGAVDVVLDGERVDDVLGQTTRGEPRGEFGFGERRDVAAVDAFVEGGNDVCVFVVNAMRSRGETPVADLCVIIIIVTIPKVVTTSNCGDSSGSTNKELLCVGKIIPTFSKGRKDRHYF